MRKFLTHEPELKRLTAKFFQLISDRNGKQLTDTEESSVNQELLDMFKVELLKFSIVMAKDIKVRNVHFERRRLALQQKVNQQKSNNAEMQGKISQLHEKLEQAGAERQRKIEYDRVAEMIQQYPTVEQVSRDIKGLEMEFERLESIKERVMQQLEFRKQKCEEAQQYMSQLKQELSLNRVEESEILASTDETQSR